SEEMMWELSQIRLALIGKEAPAGKDASPSKTNGLYMASPDAVKETIKKIVKHIDEIVKSLAGVPDEVEKVAETLSASYEDLEEVVSNPAAEQPPEPKPSKPAVGRTRPQGNAPAGASTVGE
ncbi:MAG TPA: hypothetical protein VFX03_16755, partial [Thermomicrobiales bacterium]|nr:hypothetical protein [Thermomicrobiales bacterium]